MKEGSRRLEVLTWVARAFTTTEDVVYIGLGFLLASSALTLLAKSVIDFWQGVVGGKISTIEVLDRILLVLLIVELLYTVQVSLREHSLAVEPFLLVGIISAIRRVLVLTAEFDGMHQRVVVTPQQFAIELAVLTVLILALAMSLLLLRRRSASVAAEPA